MNDRLRSDDWEVRDANLNAARALIEKHHYAKGASKTFVYVHGLYRKGCRELSGVAWWMPPIKPAAVKVAAEDWRKVLSLSRLVIIPEVPKNAATFLLGRSIRKIKDGGDFDTLLTFADTAQNHIGTIYKASNWKYEGLSSKTELWIDPKTGRMMSSKSGKRNFTKQEMKDKGWILKGRYAKHRFVLRLKLQKRPRFTQLNLLDSDS